MANLQLDDVPVEPIYRTFEGRYVDAMPALLTEGRVPMSISALMARRLQVLKSRQEALINSWWENYFDSDTAVARSGNEVKIVPCAQLLREVMPKSKLNRGALVLTDAQYQGLTGKTVSVQTLKSVGLNDWLTKEKVLAHPVWQAAAGGVLQQYVDAHFKRYDAKAAWVFGFQMRGIAL